MGDARARATAGLVGRARRAQSARPGRRSARAALLGGANPLRGEDSIRLFVSRTGGVGPEALKRALLRLDRKDIAGTLELAGVTEAEPAQEEERRTLAQQGRSRRDPAAGLVGHARRDRPALERPPRVAALLVAPANPTRPGTRLALQFRVARHFGYGVSPGMARRCLERLDEEEVGAELRCSRALRHGRRRHAGSCLARRRQSGLSA